MSPRPQLREPSEAEFKDQVIELARMFGYTQVVHFRPAQDRRGHWKTPLQGDTGWPDLTLCRPAGPRGARLVFLELKVGKKKLRPDQVAWIEALDSVPGVDARTVWPRDLNEIAALLK